MNRTERNKDRKKEKKREGEKRKLEDEILSNKKRSLSRTVVSRGNLQHPRSKNQPKFKPCG